MHFYIHKNGEQLGPIEASEIQSHIASGQFSEDDLAWTEGATEWKPLREVLPSSRAAQNNIAGAASFKDWWFTVWVRAPTVIMPARCGCCLATEGLQQKEICVENAGGDGKIRYSICPSCAKHAVIDNTAVAIAIVAGIIIPPVIYYLMFGLKFLRSGWELTLTVYLICGLLVAGLFYYPIYRFCPWKSRDCANGDWPVDSEPEPMEEALFGNKNERTDEREYRQHCLRMHNELAKNCVALRFTNRKFLCEFITLNGGDPSQIVTIEEKF